MNQAPFLLSALDSKHNRNDFKSSSEALNHYLKHQVNQDIRRRVAGCFVAIHQDQRIAGYYTLASASVRLSDLPSSIGKKLPRYPSIPAVRMGRLAIDQEFEGKGLGSALLADALAKAASSEIAAFALIVDTKDTQAARFYLHHGFIALPDSPLTLFLALATLKTFKNDTQKIK